MLGGGFNFNDPARQRNSRLNRVGEPLAYPFTNHEPVDHDRDRMFELAVEFDLLVEHPQLPVNLDARVAIGAKPFKELPVFALAVPDQRRHHEQPRRLRQFSDLIDDLVG